VVAGGNNRTGNDMATKKTTKEELSGESAQTRKRKKSIASLLARLRKVEPPDSEEGLAEWVLTQMLVEMAGKLANTEEIRFNSGEALRLIQTLQDYWEAKKEKNVKGIRVEWVEPEKP
jgi:hypothetical protein